MAMILAMPDGAIADPLPAAEHGGEALAAWGQWEKHCLVRPPGCEAVHLAKEWNELPPPGPLAQEEGRRGLATESEPCGIWIPPRVPGRLFRVPCLYRGNLSLLSTHPPVAIVGSRLAAATSLEWAAELSAGFCARQACVLSGLARGDDTAALRIAADYPPGLRGIAGIASRAIAAIAMPLSTAFPPENSDLQAEIARSGLLLSPVPLLRHAALPNERGTWSLLRNEIIAAVSSAVIVTDVSHPRSGTLATARAALRRGTPLFLGPALLDAGGLPLRWLPLSVRQRAVPLLDRRNPVGQVLAAVESRRNRLLSGQAESAPSPLS